MVGRSELAGGEAAGELPVHGLLAPPGVAGVHNIVVDKGAGLKQFQSRCSGEDLRAVAAASRPPAPVAERWPEALTAREEPLHGIEAGEQVVANTRERLPLLRQKVLKRVRHLGSDSPEVGLAARGRVGCHVCRG